MRHDADDGVGLAPQVDGAAESGGVAVEDALPEIVTEDGYGGAAVFPGRASQRRVFGGREFAAKLRGHAEHAEISRGDALLLDDSRCPAVAKLTPP